MNNEKRLARLLMAFVMASLLLCIAFATWFSIELRHIQYIVAIKPSSIVGKEGDPGSPGFPGLSVVGPQGLQGSQGIQGAQGSQGQQGIQGNASTVPGPQGEKGETGQQGQQGAQGEPGASGRAVFLRTNSDTGTEECRYAGDDAWQPAEECK